MTIAILNKLEDAKACIRLKSNVDANTVLTELHAFFDRAFYDGYTHILFDMENLDFPGASFIAFLIGKTMDFRRKNGNIQIINCSETARNHFAMFTPLTFLSFEIENESGFSANINASRSVEPPQTGDSIQVPARIEDVSRITDFISDCLTHSKLAKVERSKLKIAVYEACLNVIEHGYGFEPGHFINIDIILTTDQVKIVITDHGNSFDFYNVQPYDVNSAFEARKKNGYGLYIIKRSVDEIEYNMDPIQGNRLTLIKNIV